MSQIIKLDNPFRKYQRQIIQVKPGDSIGHIIKRELKDNKKYDCELLTFVNSQLIPTLERDKRILREGECLFVVPKIADGDDGKAILNIALMIAVITFAPTWANALWQTTAGGMGVFITTVAFTVGGAMLISALTPTPKIPSSGFLDDEQSQSFGWNPMTIQRQGIAIPRAYGLNKIYGNVISAHTEKESLTYEETTIAEKFYYDKKIGGISIQGTRYVQITEEFDPRKVNLSALFNLGIGPIREPVVEGTLKLNDEFIENLDSVYSEARRGNLRQLPISYFEQTKLEVVVNRLVVYGTPVTYVTKNANFNDLEIELSFPGGLFDGSGADLANNTVNVTVEIKKTTGDTWTKLADNVAITDNVGNKVIETYSTSGVFTVDYGSNYEIRITKETAERDNIKYGDHLYLDKVREVINHPFIYPRRALVGVKALATNQLSGSIRFSCLSRGLYVRFYDGAWSIEYSNNPAWVIYDILTQPVYTGEHSPWLDLKLLLNFNGADEAVTTVDDSERAHIVNFTETAQLDTAEKKFGTAALLLDGDSDDVNIANDNHSFDICENIVDNWTIDFFVKFADHVGLEYLIIQYEDGNNRWFIRNLHGTALSFILRVGGVNVITVDAAEIDDTNWHHVAVCKVGADFGLYVDEAQVGYDLMVAADAVLIDGDLFIGQSGADASWFQGHIDHVRIIKSNIFNAAPVAGLTDTITEPTAEYTDPGNSYAVSRYDGYNPSKLLTADFEELADWCDEPQVNPENFGITSISQATHAIIVTTSNHNLKVGDTVLFRGAGSAGMVELVDGTTAVILSVTNKNTFTIDLDTSAYSAYTGAEPKLLVHFDGVHNSTSFTDEVGTHTITTIGDTKVSTAQKKFGTGSGSFPGTDDALSIPDHADWDIVGNNADNWTVDFWLKHTSHTGFSQDYVEQTVDIDNGWAIYHKPGSGLAFIVLVADVDIIWSGYGGEITDLNWHHIALCKVANKYAMYKDGVQINYVEDNSTTTFAGKLFIGSFYSVAEGYLYEFNGYMEELCIIQNNRFNASPNVGKTNIIAVPTAPLTIGVGTVEKYQPRFAFNGIFDTETNMWEAALSVCELCRCIPFWDGDTIRLAIDKAGSSVYAYTMGNILKDSFKQKFIPMAERASEIEVHYRDAAKDYVRMPFTLMNDDIGNTTSKTRLDLFGITDTDMANRLTDFKLLQNLHLKKIVILEADIESIGNTIGDIVDVQHDVINWGKIGSGDDDYTGGGRIIAVSKRFDWIGINSSHLDSYCGFSNIVGDDKTLEEALNGEDFWGHEVDENHELIFDLGDNYEITKISARSDSPADPTDVNIYISETNGDWGVAVASGISTWQDTTEFVEVEITATTGRFIKIEIVDTEHVDNYIYFGDVPPFSIFDVYAKRTNDDVITIEGNIYFDDADFNGGSTTYKLLIKSATDATPESKVITGLSESSVAGGSFDITVSGTYTVEPKRDDIWAAGEENLETNKYRILDIRRTEENKAEITAIEYNELIYAND